MIKQANHSVTRGWDVFMDKDSHPSVHCLLTPDRKGSVVKAAPVGFPDFAHCQYAGHGWADVSWATGAWSAVCWYRLGVGCGGL